MGSRFGFGSFKLLLLTTIKWGPWVSPSEAQSAKMCFQMSGQSDCSSVCSCGLDFGV